MKLPARLRRHRYIDPPDPMANERAKLLFVDVRSGAYLDGEVSKGLPLRYGQVRIEHGTQPNEAVVAVEVMFQHTLHAFEEARLLRNQGFEVWVAPSFEESSKQLRRILEEHRKASKERAQLRAL